jgi:hypothetical protein
MNGYSSLHFYIQKRNLCNTEEKKYTVLFEKKKLMFICQKLEARIFLRLVGTEVFLKLFHLMCHLFKSDTASKVFRQSPCIYKISGKILLIF